jgi:A/G-specific adenine glycosylase
VDEFVTSVTEFYGQAGRDLPWRKPEVDGSFDPYKIMVSEFMLQQTQVARVIPKFLEFTSVFTGVESLSRAGLGEVLTLWSGLGYNRRAKFLWQAAQKIQELYQGEFPKTLNMLTILPGIGPNTAAAILVYAYDQPLPFIETNIRTAFIHHFFRDNFSVSDKDLWPLITDALQCVQQRRELSVREWYWALMDYGSHLKKTVGNTSRQSKHYAKQSRFEGSKRQIRGKILKALASGEQTESQLKALINDERFPYILQDLLDEHMIVRKAKRLKLP